MKKALAMVLALVMCLGLVACAGSGSNSTPATTKASTDTQAPAAEGSGKAAEGKTMLYYTPPTSATSAWPTWAGVPHRPLRKSTATM